MSRIKQSLISFFLPLLAWWHRPSAVVLLAQAIVEISHSVEKMAEAQARRDEAFVKLLDVWNAPPPPAMAPGPYYSTEEREMLAELKRMAKDGDLEAQNYLESPENTEMYFALFR